MSQFLESILLTQGALPLLHYHQSRVDKTLASHGGTTLSLIDLLDTQRLPSNGVYKVRIVYDIQGQAEIQVIAYQQKLITSLTCVEVGDYDYGFKYANRSKIQEFHKSRGSSDDILMLKSGKVTDTSYGNVAFWDGYQWTIPSHYLLNGCRRAQVLDTCPITEKEIGIEDLLQFQFICIYNAMIPLGRILIPTSRIILPS